MLIKINNYKSESVFKKIISQKLSRFGNHLTHVEVDFKDLNGPIKHGADIQCKLTAKQKNHLEPIISSADGVSEEQALVNAADKLSKLLYRIVEKSKVYQRNAS